jgi:hypothetical protein
MTNINGYLNMTFVSRFQPPKAMLSARCYDTFNTLHDLASCRGDIEFPSKGKKFLTLTLNQGESNTAKKRLQVSSISLQ